MYLIAGVICGIIAAVIASGKGRNGLGWFFGGFFLGIVGIVIVAVIPNLKQEKARWEEDDIEHHRLRERMKQEKIKNESFRGHAAGRLDAHDGALGMDTRSIQGPPPTPGMLTEGLQRSGPPPNPSEAIWYYDLNGETRGPVSETDIKAMLRSRQIGGTTILWSESMSEWTPAKQIETFRSMAGS